MPEDDDHPAPPPPSGGDIDRVEVRQKQTMRLLAGIAGAGLVASIAFAAQFGTSKFVSVFATALMLAAGSAMGGVLLGFLFALPRARRSEAYAPEQPSPSQPAATELTSEREATTRPNTNLEDISDWLTKILVGVGLIELASIGEALGRLSSAVAPALGGVGGGPFGLALMSTFAFTGFMTGYLWTRFYIPAAFERAESDVRKELYDLRQKTEEFAARSGAVVEDATTQVQEQVQEQIEQTLEHLGQPLPEALSSPPPALESARKLARDYERVRYSQGSGPTRTFEMSRIAARARSLGGLHFTPGEIRQLFMEGEGGRVIALAIIAAKPHPELAGLAREAIANSSSAFEQYQALRAAQSLANSVELAPTDSRELRAAIEEQMRPGPQRYLTPNSDRWPIARDLLTRL